MVLDIFYGLETFWLRKDKENALLGNILLIYGCVDKWNTYLIWDGNIMVQGVH